MPPGTRVTSSSCYLIGGKWELRNPLRAAQCCDALCPLMSWCMNATLVSNLLWAAFMHHTYSMGLIHSQRVGIMQPCSTGELFARVAFNHGNWLSSLAFIYRTDSIRFDLIQSKRVGMMHSCSPGMLLTRASFMQHFDKGDSALKHCAALIKGLTRYGFVYDVCWYDMHDSRNKVCRIQPDLNNIAERVDWVSCLIDYRSHWFSFVACIFWRIWDQFYLYQLVKFVTLLK